MLKPLALAGAFVVALIGVSTHLVTTALPAASAVTPTHPTQPPALARTITVQATQRAAVVTATLDATLRAITSIEQAKAAQAAAQARAEAQRASTVASSYTTARSVASTPTTYAAPSGNSIWSCIIARESGGNPAAVNPSSGAGGLFQFLPSSWQAYGGSGLPEDASVGEQWAIAEHAQAVSGWYPWVGDGCTPVG